MGVPYIHYKIMQTYNKTCCMCCWTIVQEAELESIKLAQQLDEVKEEKERLLNSLVEAEYVFLL